MIATLGIQQHAATEHLRNLSRPGTGSNNDAVGAVVSLIRYDGPGRSRFRQAGHLLLQKGTTLGFEMRGELLCQVARVFDGAWFSI